MLLLLCIEDFIAREKKSQTMSALGMKNAFNFAWMAWFPLTKVGGAQMYQAIRCMKDMPLYYISLAMQCTRTDNLVPL